MGRGSKADSLSRSLAYNEKETTTYRIDPTKTPKTIDGTNERGRVERGIYELDGDSLKICYTYGEERPTTFATKPGSKVALILLRRAKP